ncbi:MAG TPA: restriction endonuclease subunit S [Flavobacterium sp.]|jgi:type I restriction enzyme S subunit
MMEKRNVPRLRFPGFEGEWNSKTLREISDYVDYRGKTPQKTEEGVYLVTAKNIKQGYIDYEISKEYILETDYESVMRRGKPKIGDVLITTEAPLGNVAAIDREDIALAQRVIKLRGKQKVISNDFLKHRLISPQFQQIISDRSSGSTAKGIKGAELHKIQILFPSSEEQNKIANVLSVIDEMLNRIKKKKALLEKYKKGMMQKIFNQEIRFKDEDGKDFEEWQARSIGDVAEIIGGGTPETGNEEYWNGNIHWFTPTEIKQKYATKSARTITPLGLQKSSAKLLPVGALLLTTRATIGDVSIATEECATNQGFQSLVSKEGYNNVFLYNWIKMNKHELVQRANGSTFPEISKSEIEQIPLSVPGFEEQTKIANFLSAIDDKINLVAVQIEKMEKFKKGLLNEMFV